MTSLFSRGKLFAGAVSFLALYSLTLSSDEDETESGPENEEEEDPETNVGKYPHNFNNFYNNHENFQIRSAFTQERSSLDESSIPNSPSMNTNDSFFSVSKEELIKNIIEEKNVEIKRLVEHVNKLQGEIQKQNLLIEEEQNAIDSKKHTKQIVLKQRQELEQKIEALIN